MDISSIQRDSLSHFNNTKNIERTSHENSTQTSLNNQDENLSQKLKDATEKLNRQMETLGTNVRFAFNDKINEMYVNVTEKDSGKLIRKIPSEEVMKLIEHFKGVIGTIFDKES
ncbi:flagellar protein FlaG [Campylobacter peloridis]|uniref:Flagellar protein FlaG n=2 Tax=Campylobacter peloridis TaxID=488546 RepID=A0ABX6TSQ1_9BACT|nr:FlaG family protein [Campylobacter peloridis]AJC84659.1 flagellar protein FlaG [Campylobacter peloridis LMG 23910]QOQ88727.1 flagellar protein FlaG [Campylobacter peloridis]